MLESELDVPIVGTNDDILLGLLPRVSWTEGGINIRAFLSLTTSGSLVILNGPCEIVIGASASLVLVLGLGLGVPVPMALRSIARGGRHKRRMLHLGRFIMGPLKVCFICGLGFLHPCTEDYVVVQAAQGQSSTSRLEQSPTVKCSYSHCK